MKKNLIFRDIIIFGIILLIPAGLIFGLCKLFEAKEPTIKYLGVVEDKYIVCEIYNPSSIHARHDYSNYEIKSSDFYFNVDGELFISDGIKSLDSSTNSLSNGLVVKGKETFKIKIHFDTRIDLTKQTFYFKGNKIN